MTHDAPAPTASPKHDAAQALQRVLDLIGDSHALTDLTPAQCNPWLRTPVLTPEIRAKHEQQGVAPIAVYPEPIDGNPLGAPSPPAGYSSNRGMMVSPPSTYPAS